MTDTEPHTVQTIRFGIIGTGAIVRIVRPAFLDEGANSAEASASPGRARVVAVADVNAEAARAESEALGGVRIFNDYHELLADPEVDAVYIATPPFLHHEMVLAALDAGKHTLCEKPFMMDGREAQSIASVHDQSSSHLKLACCSSRFHASPPARAARRLIAEGGIGEVVRVRAIHRSPPPAPLDTLPGWKRERKTNGGGLAMDWGVYDLDWLRYVLGEAFDPVGVFAQTEDHGREHSDLESGFASEIVLRSGALVHWERWAEHGPAGGRVEIRGTRGGIDLPFTPGIEPEALIRFRYDEAGNLTRDVLSDPLTSWPAILQYPIHDLATAVAAAHEVASPAAAQVVIHQVIDALYESAASGRTAACDRRKEGSP
jgi:predicted dehydrogenase